MAPAAADTHRRRRRAAGLGPAAAEESARGAQAQRRLRWRGRPGRARCRGGPQRKAVPLIGPPDAGGGPRWGWRGLPGAETPAAAVALLRAVLPPCLPVSCGVVGTSLPRPGVHPPSSVRRAAGLGGKPAVPRTAFAPRRRVQDALPRLPENSYSTFQTQHKYFLKEAFSNSLPTNTFDLLGLSVLSLFHHCAYVPLLQHLAQSIVTLLTPTTRTREPRGQEMCDCACISLVLRLVRGAQ
uniref:uncharacterized protein LOC129506156 n=1 Tax=Nyctereutes procyonoides TaxID=34880 RepID=UPI0024442F73|nr:uncharacterized protein LOC129506156 [Nyctereutes procyonoides]